MTQYLKRFMGRPDDIDPTTPRGFAIGTTIAAVLIMVFPAVGIVFAVVWQLSATIMSPELARIASFATLFVALIASVPAVVWVYWAAMRSVQGDGPS